MKTASVGFEIGFTAALTNCKVSFPIIPAIILRGYQFDLAMRPMGGTPVNPDWATDILFQARLGNPVANTDFGNVSLSQGVTGYNSEGALFCTAILKTWGTAPVNKVITLSDLAVPAAAGEPLLFNVYISGTPFDFEVGGTLYYDLA